MLVALALFVRSLSVIAIFSRANYPNLNLKSDLNEGSIKALLQIAKRLKSHVELLMESVLK